MENLILENYFVLESSMSIISRYLVFLTISTILLIPFIVGNIVILKGKKKVYKFLGWLLIAFSYIYSYIGLVSTDTSNLWLVLFNIYPIYTVTFIVVFYIIFPCHVINQKYNNSNTT